MGKRERYGCGSATLNGDDDSNRSAHLIEYTCSRSPDREIHDGRLVVSCVRLLFRSA